MEPAPPRIVALDASAWSGGRCWECDLPVNGDEGVVYDGRIWHPEHWRGDLSELRQARVAAQRVARTRCSPLASAHHHR